MDAAAPAADQHRFEFIGSGGEYFRIWIVNLALSILTLGIYSAWATVRNRRYLYGNTRLADDHFEYLAEPVSILKGRIIAVMLLLLYSFGPLALQGVIGLLIVVAVPWLIVRSLRFRAVMSRWRGIRFGFAGRTGEAYRVWIIYLLLMIFTLGLALPWAQVIMARYRFANHRFGKTGFGFHATAAQYYKIYALGGLIFLGLFATAAVIAPDMTHVFVDERRAELQARVDAEATALIDEAIEAGEAMTPELVAEKRREAFHFALTEEERAWLAASRDKLARIIGGIVVLMMLVAYFVWSFISTRFINLNYSSTVVGDDFGLRSEIPVWGMFWITVTNTVAILLSLGLLLPWATCRRLRYRFAYLTLVAGASLDNFVADTAAEVSALGDEIGDVFDVDVGM